METATQKARISRCLVVLRSKHTHEVLVKKLGNELYLVGGEVEADMDPEQDHLGQLRQEVSGLSLPSTTSGSFKTTLPDGTKVTVLIFEVHNRGNIPNTMGWSSAPDDLLTDASEQHILKMARLHKKLR